VPSLFSTKKGGREGEAVLPEPCAEKKISIKKKDCLQSQKESVCPWPAVGAETKEGREGGGTPKRVGVVCFEGRVIPGGWAQKGEGAKEKGTIVWATHQREDAPAPPGSREKKVKGGEGARKPFRSNPRREKREGGRAKGETMKGKSTLSPIIFVREKEEEGGGKKKSPRLLFL